MYPRNKKTVLIFVLVFAIPTTALAAEWLFGRHSGLRQVAPDQQTAHELLKLYQLREFCNQSNAIEMRLDFAIQKLRDQKAYWNNKIDRSEGTAITPKQVTTNVGPTKAATPFVPDFEVAESQTHLLLELRNRQSQNLRNRNFRYLEKMFEHVAKYGAEDPSVWSTVQAKHDELAEIVKSGDFQACMAELDSVLPTKVMRGGRQ